MNLREPGASCPAVALMRERCNRVAMFPTKVLPAALPGLVSADRVEVQRVAHPAAPLAAPDATRRGAPQVMPHTRDRSVGGAAHVGHAAADAAERRGVAPGLMQP